MPIFDKFDYEQKLERAINRNYLDNNYDYYLFKHNKTPEQIMEAPSEGALGTQSGWKGTE